ncbi:unnamed protein product, partial [Heterosigma akashiwo]
ALRRRPRGRPARGPGHRRLPAPAGRRPARTRTRAARRCGGRGRGEAGAAAGGGVLHSSEKSHQQQDQSTPKGCLTVSFFEKKKKKGWFNTTEERMVFEKWFFPIALVPQSSRNPQIEQQAAEDNLKRQICKIFEIVNGAIDHIPSVEYYFEIAAQKLRRSSTAVAAGTSRGGLTAGGGQQAAPSLLPPQMAGG